MEEQPITINKTVKKCLRFLMLGCFLGFAVQIRAGEVAGLGFVYDHFKLTLEDGYRTEAAGPFYYSEKKDSQVMWALPPFFSSHVDSGTDSEEEDILYPVISHLRYGQEHRWQITQLLSFSGGQEQDFTGKKRVTVFPFYFQQRAPDTNYNYTAVFPFYGHLKNRLFRDSIYFVMFPFYGETRKRDIVTDNYVFPFVHVRHGNGLRGWQVWPVVGSEHKEVTSQTNGYGDVSVVAGHDKSFFIWPLHLRQDTGIGTDNPEKFRASIPLYAYTRSPKLDSTTVLWPLFTWMDNREKKYREWQMPWPLVIFARGEGKTTSRVFPLFSQSHNATLESDSYLWPLYVYRRTHADPLDQQKTRVLFYLYSRMTEKNTATGAEKRRLDMWPFFTWNRDFKGNERLQVLALLEPVLPGNRGIERNWSPLWSLWRAEDNVETKATSQSLLWNLYRRETAPAHKKVSLLFGLFQYECTGEAWQTKLFYLPISKTAPAAK